MAFDFGQRNSGTGGFDSGFGRENGQTYGAGQSSGNPGGFSSLPQINGSNFPQMGGSSLPQSGYPTTQGDPFNVFDSASGSTGPSYKKHQGRTPSRPVNVPWKLIFTLVAALAVIILLVVFKDVILSTLTSILTMIILIAVVLLILKFLFRS